MKSGLIALLAAQSSITSLCSTRIYMTKAPQGAAFPHVILTQMGSNENPSIDGGSGQLRFLTFDIDCKARTAAGAEALGNAVRTFLDDYSGSAGSYTIGAVIMNGETDDFESPQDGSDQGVYTVTLDVEIQYSTT